jgi:tRNA U38,U39,U40 pseudouridine synthase TruA
LISIILKPSAFKHKEEFLTKINQELARLHHDDIQVNNLIRVQYFFNPKNFCKGREYLYILPVSMIDPKPLKNAILNTTLVEENKTPTELLEKFNAILAKYVGRKAYHNYTEKVAAGHDSSYRYQCFSFDLTQCRIMREIKTVKLTLPNIEEQESILTEYREKHKTDSEDEQESKGIGLSNIANILPLKMAYIDDTDIFQIEGHDDLRFVCIKFKGNRYVICQAVNICSFMLHQIRKMVGMAVSGS